jgi:hypothetical protein
MKVALREDKNNREGRKFSLQLWPKVIILLTILQIAVPYFFIPVLAKEK